MMQVAEGEGSTRVSCGSDSNIWHYHTPMDVVNIAKLGADLKSCDSQDAVVVFGMQTDG
jgi:hypothetical protein